MVQQCGIFKRGRKCYKEFEEPKIEYVEPKKKVKSEQLCDFEKQFILQQKLIMEQQEESLI